MRFEEMTAKLRLHRDGKQLFLLRFLSKCKIVSSRVLQYRVMLSRFLLAGILTWPSPRKPLFCKSFRNASSVVIAVFAACLHTFRKRENTPRHKNAQTSRPPYSPVL